MNLTLTFCTDNLFNATVNEKDCFKYETLEKLVYKSIYTMKTNS